MDFHQYQNTLASIQDTTKLASRPDYTSLCQNRHTPSFSHHCLQAACFLLDICHLHASHLKQEHRLEHARLAAKTSNAIVKKPLNSLLQVEATSATFCKLKCYAKGECCTALQREKVPILDTNSQPTGTSTSITNL